MHAFISEVVFVCVPVRIGYVFMFVWACLFEFVSVCLRFIRD